MTSIGFLQTPSNMTGASFPPSQTVLTSNQSAALNTTTVKLSVPAGNGLVIHWGDGNADVVTCDGTLKTLTHDYSVQATYNISLTGDYDEVTNFQAFSQTWVEGDVGNLVSLTGLQFLFINDTNISGALSGISSLTLVEQFSMNNTPITGSLSDIASWSSLERLYATGTALGGNLSSLTSMPLTNLWLSNSSVVGDLSSISGATNLAELVTANLAITGQLSDLSSMTSMTRLYLQNTNVDGDLADISSMTSLIQTFIFGSDVDTYTQGTLPAWSNNDIRIYDLGLDSVEVDDFINDLDAAGGTNGTLDISGTNAAHSTASDTAITNLQGDGWTVNVNAYFITSNQTGGLNQTSITLMVPTGESVTIHWGDGTSTAVTADWSPRVYTHDYASTEKWGVHLTGDVDEIRYFQTFNQSWVEGDVATMSVMTKVTRLYLYSTSLSGSLSAFSGMTTMDRISTQGTSIGGALSNIGSITSITRLNVADSPVTGSLADISTLTSLTELKVFTSAISGALSNISGMTSMVTLVANGSSVSGDIADLSGMTSATTITLYNSSVDTYTQGTLPAWGSASIQIHNLTLDSVEVDDFINDLDTAGGTNGTLNIGGTNAARSNASDTGLSNLETDGWTVTVNEPIFTSNQVGGLNQTSVQARLPSGNSATIRWGDGTTTAMVADNTLRTYTHDYSTQEKWGVDVDGDVDGIDNWRVFNQAWVEGHLADVMVMPDLVGLYYYSTGMTGNLSDISSLSSIVLLQLYSTSITGALSSLSSMTSMLQLHLSGLTVTGGVTDVPNRANVTYLNLSGTSITGNITGLSTMTNVVSLFLNATSVTGDLSVISNLTSATTIYIYDTGCDQYTGSTALPPFGSTTIRIEDNGLSSTEVDDFLIDLEDGGNNGNNGTLNIAGTNAARTSASDTAYNNLITDGWSITVN